MTMYIVDSVVLILGVVWLALLYREKQLNGFHYFTVGDVMRDVAHLVSGLIMVLYPYVRETEEKLWTMLGNLIFN